MNDFKFGARVPIVTAPANAITASTTGMVLRGC